MKKRTIAGIVSLMALSALLIPTAPATAAKKKAAGPTVVGTDDVGDWGTNADPNLAPLGDVLGQDIVEASIEMADAKTVNFIITVNALPPTGGIPEFSRYNWDFTVDGDAYQLTGAFTEFLRGVCNPLHTNSCPPPQNPGLQPFFIRQGPCTVPNECNVLGIAHATFDTATATITIPVPLDIVGGKPGSKIGPAASSLGGGVYAAPAAVVSYASLPNDTMVVLKTYVVPK